MRTQMIVLAALAGLLLGTLAAVLFGGPSHAQTAINCSTAAHALAASNHAGKQLDLRVTYDDMDTVNDIIRGSLGSSKIGQADNIQIYYLESDTYMLMASVQGCHVAHVFVDESAFVEYANLSDTSGESRTSSTAGSG